MPCFVIYSYKVIRDPVYWFCSLSGLCLFVAYLHNKKWYYVPLSLLFFIIGAWARVEGCLYLITSLIFIFYVNKVNKKIIFIIVLSCITLFVCKWVFSLYLDVSILKILPYEKLYNRIKYTVQNYELLRDFIKKFEDYETGGKFHYFFSNTKNLLWWIAIGSLLQAIVKALYFPFFVILCIGFYKITERIKKDIRICFLFFNILGGIVILYMQTIFNWAIATRYIALLLFPSFVFIGYGIEAIIKFIESKKYIIIVKYSTFILAIFILLITSNKNFFRRRNQDNIVYREVGQYIAKIEKYRKRVEVAGSFKRINLIHFYANLDYPGVTCFPYKNRLLEKKLTPNIILTTNVDYYIWDKKSSSKISLELIKESKYFKELHRWNTKKRGEIVLFKVIK